MNVTLIDSPVANVANIARALRTVGATLRLTSEAAEISSARKLVLPGVGSFGAAMAWLTLNAVDTAIHEAVANGASLLGICVGHQLLFDASHELGLTRGLGLLRGEVRKLDGELPVPQIGWNRVSLTHGRHAPSPVVVVEKSTGNATGGGACPPFLLFDGVAEGTPFYFVNSYAARGADAEIARADYGGSFTAAVQRERVFGVQFHPEKSSTAGLQVLRNFVSWT